MTTSPSAIMEGMTTLLSAASVYGTGMVGRGTYDVLERASGSCAVIECVGLSSEVDAFGNGQKTRTYTFVVQNFYKDTGDGVTYKNRAIQGMGKVIACLESDQTYQGQLDPQTGFTSQIQGKLTPGQVVQVGGTTVWIPFPVQVVCHEFV